MELSKYVACICEGGAERTIVGLLLNDHRLIFDYDNLLDGEILRCRKAKDFEERYLRKGFSEQVTGPSDFRLSTRSVRFKQSLCA